MSDSGIVRSVNRVPVGSRGFSAGIPEEECVLVGEVDRKFRALVTGNGSDKKSFSPEVRISKEEIGHSGDGQGKRGKSGGSHGDDSYGHKIQIGDYYSEIEIESCRLASTRKLRQIFTEGGKRYRESGGVLRESDLSESRRWRDIIVVRSVNMGPARRQDPN
ncbi:uncharacterized protein LOC120200025 [Hibiscus syriacus]|uniref:uncharacterized protein LOC120200025 n=1 Tax=Hibiscus syriacus TaxID=106335 RepID=UPI0019225281|nr:uncharacterized protein LOC120200025 [Hibiscus syriacus]